jgi:hypothetical protein
LHVHDFEDLQGHLEGLGLPKLDLNVFYLDDGVLAGSQESVAAAINFVEGRFADIGLALSRSTCELIPVAGRDHFVDLSLFTRFQFLEAGSFKLLGAAFGSSEFCSELLIKICVKAKHLLTQLSAMDDAQTALLLARRCSGFCNVAYSMRTVPPLAHARAGGIYGPYQRFGSADFFGRREQDGGGPRRRCPSGREALGSET